MVLRLNYRRANLTVSVMKPSLCVKTPRPRLIASVSKEKHNAYLRFFKHKQKWTKRLYIAGGVGVTGFLLWWLYWPHHSFSSPVAKVLRKALWAESDKEHFDYEKALGLYKEALEVAQEEELDELSDEYTGIEIKMGEMLEKQNKFEDAALIYLAQSQRYFKALKSVELEKEKRNHFIQKDLRVVTKYIHITSNVDSMDEMFLASHFSLAMEEVSKGLSHALETGVTKYIFEPTDLDSYPSKAIPKLIVGSKSIHFLPNYKLEPVWGNFREEFFNVRDLAVSMLMRRSQGLDRAAELQVSTTKYMIESGCELGPLIDAMNLCGSLLYLKAESKELMESRSEDVETKVDYRQQKKDLLNQSVVWYRSGIKLLKSLDSNIVENNPQLANILGHSYYSLGVIYLHLGLLIEARSLFDKAKQNAERHNYSELLKETGQELLKLEKYEKLAENY